MIIVVKPLTQMCMMNSREGVFSKKFKEIDMIWVDQPKIPLNTDVEKEVKKINKGVKKFNLTTSVINESGVFMRDNSCVSETCQNGDELTCPLTQCGNY